MYIPVSNFGVDGADGLHVVLPPLPAQILGLHLEQLQHVQLQHSVLNLENKKAWVKLKLAKKEKKVPKISPNKNALEHSEYDSHPA